MMEREWEKIKPPEDDDDDDEEEEEEWEALLQRCWVTQMAEWRNVRWDRSSDTNCHFFARTINQELTDTKSQIYSWNGEILCSKLLSLLSIGYQFNLRQVLSILSRVSKGCMDNPLTIQR